MSESNQPPELGEHNISDAEQAFYRAQSLFNEGQFSEAEGICGDILADAPGIQSVLHLAGLSCLQLDRVAPGAEHFARAVEAGKADPQLFLHYGIALSRLRDVDGATKAYGEAIRLNPDFLEAHRNLGRMCLENGRQDEAELAYSEAVRVAPMDVRAREDLGNAYLAAGKYDDAIAEFQAAIEIDPDSPLALNNLAGAMNSLGKSDEAVGLFRRALELAPDDISVQANLGAALHGAGRADEAIEVYRKALGLKPDSAHPVASLAISLERANRVEEADAEVSRALALDPENRNARLTGARLHERRGRTAKCIAALQDLSRPDAPRDSVYRAAINELGHTLDRDGRFEAAFSAFAESNGNQIASRAADGFDRDLLPRMIARNKEWFTPGRVSAWKEAPGFSTPAPIFVVGFPRSGTTLVEQTLAAHPRLSTSDERQFIHQMIRSKMDGFPEWLDDMADADIEQLREDYWRRAAAELGDEFEGRRLVDKNPMNIIHLGFIRRIFPEAVILVVLRDPRDAVLSFFMQRFRMNESSIHILDLESSARYYAATMGLWCDYRELPGLNAHPLRYEDTVEDTEFTNRRMLEIIGEEWDDQVEGRADQAAQRYISTPSFRDVSQPVYQRASGRWRNYQEQMREILPILAPFVEEFGYAPD